MVLLLQELANSETSPMTGCCEPARLMRSRMLRPDFSGAASSASQGKHCLEPNGDSGAGCPAVLGVATPEKLCVWTDPDFPEGTDCHSSCHDFRSL